MAINSDYHAEIVPMICRAADLFEQGYLDFDSIVERMVPRSSPEMAYLVTAAAQILANDRIACK